MVEGERRQVQREEKRLEELKLDFTTMDGKALIRLKRGEVYFEGGGQWSGGAFDFTLTFKKLERGEEGEFESRRAALGPTKLTYFHSTPNRVFRVVDSILDGEENPALAPLGLTVAERTRRYVAAPIVSFATHGTETEKSRVKDKIRRGEAWDTERLGRVEVILSDLRVVAGVVGHAKITVL